MSDLIERDPLLEKMFPCFEKKLVREAPAVNRWIPVEDALPETDSPVICYMRIGKILVMELSDDDGWYCGITRYNPRAVTHWMPLPSTEGLT